MTTTEPIPSSSSNSWAWWPFLFGVVVGYVLFRPGGVIDYFLLPGGFQDEVVSQSAMRQGTGGSIFNQGRDSRNNQYQRRPESGGEFGGEDWFNEGDSESPPPAPQRPGNSITLPPTDLFGP
jgi:hypothetical protein